MVVADEIMSDCENLRVPDPVDPPTSKQSGACTPRTTHYYIEVPGFEVVPGCRAI